MSNDDQQGAVAGREGHPDDMEVCGNCFYGKFHGDANDGECRANPPMPMLVPVQTGTLMQPGPAALQLTSIFPPVKRFFFCGQFGDAEAETAPPH